MSFSESKFDYRYTGMYDVINMYIGPTVHVDCILDSWIITLRLYILRISVFILFLSTDCKSFRLAANLAVSLLGCETFMKSQKKACICVRD